MKWMGKYFILFALACAGLSAAGRTLYVSPVGTNDYDGYYPDWSGAATTISAAVTRATTSGDLIWVTNATYAITAQISVTSNLTLRSWNNGNLDRTNTIVDGQISNRCFYINNSGAVIAGFTIMNGVADSGGGVYLGTSGGLLTNCVISGNAITGTAHYYGGGGVYMATGRVENCVIRGNIRSNATYYAGGGGIQLRGGWVKDCEIIGNTNIGDGGGAGVFVYGSAVLDHCLILSNNTPYPYYYGGVYFYVMNGVVLVTNCTFSGNTARSAGGAGTAAGGAVSRITISDCLFSNNLASQNYGGLYVENAGAVLRNCRIVNNQAGASYYAGGLSLAAALTAEVCVIQNNTAGYGGGVRVEPGAAPVMRTCLISGNTAGSGGGGVYEYSGLPVFENCTIVSNAGYGIYHGGGALTNVVVNCVIYSNVNAGAVSNYYNPGNAMIFTNCSTWPMPLTGSGNITNAPLFMNYAVGDYRLRPDSPCINQGWNETWMDTAVDLQGRPRLYYGRVDIGGYEYFLNVKVNGIPIDRIRRINGVDKNRIIRLNQ